MFKTYHAKAGEVLAKWHLVDADGAILGRMATRIATILQGKHHARYTPNVDTGDFVVVVNAEKVRMTGNKLALRVHSRHTGYLGGLKSITAGEMRDQHPERMIELAVRRMLPKSKLGRHMFTKLKVYRGPDHPHLAQEPARLDLRAARGKGT